MNLPDILEMSSRSNYKLRRQHGDTLAILLSAIAAFIIGVAFYSYYHLQRSNSNLESLQKAVSLLESPRDLPDFKMTNHLGNEFDNNNLSNIWSFIFFGFTHCPDVCPLTLNVLDQVSILLDKNINSQTVLISVDPKRDQPENLKEYVKHFNSDMVGLTGSVEQIELIANNLGAIYSVQDNGDEDYLVDHSAHIFVIAPDGKLSALFSTPHDAKIIANDFKIISNAYNKKQRS